MIVGFLLYVHGTRQLGVTVFVLVIQTLIYSELVNLAVKSSVEARMPGFRFFYVYWFAVFSFYMYASVLKPHILSALGLSASVEAAAASVVAASGAQHATAAMESLGSPAASGSFTAQLYALCLGSLIRVLRFIVPITFVLYMIGFVAFVVSLRRRRHFKYQFQQFGFCHLALILVVVPSTFFVSNVFQGLFWFVLPIALVVLNDSFAYVCGFLFGRTPLIRLSPKKTVEGFVGGAVMTFVGAVLFTALFSRLELWDIKWLMLCPATQDFGWTVHKCDTDRVAGGIFKTVPLGEWGVARFLPLVLHGLPVSEMQVHALALAAFASVVAPFGGFFASGFKRAFKIKDFGTAIPGHGGFTDRMDCQIVMGAFSAIYLQYVLGTSHQGGPEDVLRTFTKAVERFSPADLLLLHQLLSCFSSRLPALGDASSLSRSALLDAAAQCKSYLPQLRLSLEGYVASAASSAAGGAAAASAAAAQAAAAVAQAAADAATHCAQAAAQAVGASAVAALDAAAAGAAALGNATAAAVGAGGLPA